MDKKKAIEILDALAHESRMDIFRLLVRKGAEGCRIGTIGEEVGLILSNLSFHLDKLYKSGLVKKERQGRTVVSYVNYQVLTETMEYLVENCCRESDMNCRIEITKKKESLQ